MNRPDGKPEGGDEAGGESSAVTKQTSGTLMAGEKIMEALDIADADRKVIQDYSDMVSKLPPSEGTNVLPPTRNAVLAAYDLDGPGYVLKVVQAVPSTALHDALLVLTFSKVVSFMHYLKEWAIKVRYVAYTRMTLIANCWRPSHRS